MMFNRDVMRHEIAGEDSGYYRLKLRGRACDRDRVRQAGSEGDLLRTA